MQANYDVIGVSLNDETSYFSAEGDSFIIDNDKSVVIILADKDAIYVPWCNIVKLHLRPRLAEDIVQEIPQA